MEKEMIIVFAGIALFLTTALFGSLGIFFFLRGKKERAVILFSTGFSCIIIYFIALFVLL